MNVRRQPRKEHNHKNYDNVFVITDKTQNDDFILMQLKYKKDSGTFDVTKDVFDEVKAKYMFLTETLGWKESIDGMKNATSDAKPNDVTKLAEYLFLTQHMGWRKGLKLFGERGEEAVKGKPQHIHDMEGFQPKHWYELTKGESTKALKYFMYLKEKRDGRIKGRRCSDGQSQRAYTERIDTSSPTSSLAAIMITCMVDTFKKRDIATVEIPGAFL